MKSTRPATAVGLCLIILLAGCGSDSGSGSDSDRSEHVTETVTVTRTPGATETPAGTSPSFDCAAATSEVEKEVCDDPELAALDRQLADEYARALDRPGADTAILTSTQNGWVSGRDDCWKADDEDDCIEDAYRTRIFELKSSDPAVPVPPVVTYTCPGDKAFTAQFYDDFDPRVAVLKWGEDSVVTFAEPTASGTKYGREDVDFAEHQGEVKVDFFDNEFTCRTNP